MPFTIHILVSSARVKRGFSAQATVINLMRLENWEIDAEVGVLRTPVEARHQVMCYSRVDAAESHH